MDSRVRRLLPVVDSDVDLENTQRDGRSSLPFLTLELCCFSPDLERGGG